MSAVYCSQNAAAVAAAASAASKASASQSPTAKLLQQPSISITPLPRPTPPAPAPNAVPPVNKPGRPAGTSKATFVICEICDGYIKVLILLYFLHPVSTLDYHIFYNCKF